MPSSAHITLEARAMAVRFDDGSFNVDLVFGRRSTIPTAWHPRLLHGAPAEREQWEPIGHGKALHWEALDEDISITGLLAGRPSGERAESLQRWLDARG